MSLNPEYINAAKPEPKTISAAGIGAVNGALLVRTLSRLGLIKSSDELEKLAASGVRLSEMITRKLSIFDVDQALKKTDATTEAKMTFKSQLKNLGLMETRHT